MALDNVRPCTAWHEICTTRTIDDSDRTDLSCTFDTVSMSVQLALRQCTACINVDTYMSMVGFDLPDLTSIFESVFLAASGSLDAG
ncbi:hypothetical protein BpHYR1_053199 [Brachionus plicatilis]|uniref:Uncharacterized protein n=1 Tax=Brachionus plicatilis TaxID=10195 RepID=A0A3M7STJ5_BRAPC|nr:hypothetical protein BpHYR1_053199 [Brachionus plicatilis]